MISILNGNHIRLIKIITYYVLLEVGFASGYDTVISAYLCRDLVLLLYTTDTRFGRSNVFFSPLGVIIINCLTILSFSPSIFPHFVWIFFLCEGMAATDEFKTWKQRTRLLQVINILNYSHQHCYPINFSIEIETQKSTQVHSEKLNSSVRMFWHNLMSMSRTSSGEMRTQVS